MLSSSAIQVYSPRFVAEFREMNEFLSLTIDLRTVFEIAGLLALLIEFINGRRARHQVVIAKRQLLNQAAGEDFADMSTQAATLELQARSGNIDRVVEVAIQLTASISRAKGAWSKLLTAEESANLEATLQQTKILVEIIPVEDRAPNADEVRGIRGVCEFVSQVVNQVAGRVKYTDQEEELWRQSQTLSFRGIVQNILRSLRR